MKDKSRQHWLRVDFQNWKDEDDVGDEQESFEEVKLTLLKCQYVERNVGALINCQVGTIMFEKSRTG